MKKTKITHIPHFPTRYYDRNIGAWVRNGTLSHANYDGETQWADEQTPDGRYIQLSPTMVPNIPFVDTLYYDSFYRGRSAAGSIFKNKKGQLFTVFMTDMDKFIPHMVRGEITAEFIYCKRGQNYGVTLCER